MSEGSALADTLRNSQRFSADFLEPRSCRHRTLCDPTSVAAVELYVLDASQTAGFYITELELCAVNL